MKMEILNISELKNGQTITGRHLMIYAASIAPTKTGKKYLSAKLGNKTGTIEGRLWNLPPNFELPAVGSVWSVVATVTEFAGQLQLNIASLMPVPADIVDIADYAIEVDDIPTHEDLMARVMHISDLLTDAGATLLNDILMRIVINYSKQLEKHTAACAVHHAGVGGWLKHTLEVVNYAKAIYRQLPAWAKVNVRYDLLLLGAFLHDIGKLKSYGFENGVSVMTTTGKLLDHIVEGVCMVHTTACDLLNEKSYPDPSTQTHDVQLLEHIIASHHMELEWGSPVNPVTLEALIVCHADQLSASVDTIYHALIERPAGEPWTQKIFTQHNRQFTSALFHGPIEETETDE